MMRWFKLGWVAFLVVFFLVFSAWYGGNGKPISAEDGAKYLAQLDANYADMPEDERDLSKNLRAMIPNDDGKEFYAVNLEQLKQGQAAQEADAAYARLVIPLLLKRAGHPVFVSNRAGLMLGEYGAEVDRVAVVRYRSLRDLLDMANDPAMQAGGHHKFASLDHTEVFITRPTITFMHVRFVLALILILVGLAGLKVVELVTNRRNKDTA
ncbi:MAG: hypothetical protein ABJH52_00320 [Henriciella sp.]